MSMRPIRQYGTEDEADFRNAMSKVHNIGTVLTGAWTCIGSPAWSGSLIYPWVRSHLCSTPVSSPFHPLDLLFPLLLHAQELRKGLRAVCLYPYTASSVECRVCLPGTILSCRVENLVALSTPDRTELGASSSKAQRFDVDQANRAYDPKPAATGESLRHERATRRGLPRRGATSGTYMVHLPPGCIGRVAGDPCRGGHLSY